MEKLMANCQNVYLPLKYGEGVPRVFLEAAAVGRAVVATDTPGCWAVITVEVEGLLEPAGDSAALSTVALRYDPLHDKLSNRAPLRRC